MDPHLIIDIFIKGVFIEVIGLSLILRLNPPAILCGISFKKLLPFLGTQINKDEGSKQD